MVLGTLWTWSCVSRESSLVKDCLLNLFILVNTGQWVCVCVCVCVCVYAYYNTGVIMRTARGYNILINLRYFSPCLLFNWGIVILQYCVSFCCTMKWISYMYTYIPSLLSLPYIPPIWVITEHRAELPALCSRFPLAICFIHGSAYTSIPISQLIPTSLVSTHHSLHLCLYSCPANRFTYTIFYLLYM